MNLAEICANKLIESGEEPLKRLNNIYFTLNSLKKLPNILKDIKISEDLRISPYYFFDDNIMEPYEYALSLNIVNAVKSKNDYFLKETGKKNLSDIDNKVMELMDNTYYEALKNDVDNLVSYLQEYLNFITDMENYMLNSFRDEMNSHNASFDGIFFKIS